MKIIIALVLFILYTICQSNDDWKKLTNGYTIMSNDQYKYMDVFQVEIISGNEWVCVFHVADESEGAYDQHVVISRSLDYGKTWSKPVDIHPKQKYGPPSGRASTYYKDGLLYAFYQYNYQNITKDLNNTVIVNAFVGSEFYRVSNDKGVTWSNITMLPNITKAIDKRNEFNGTILEGYGVGKVYYDGNMYHLQYGKRTNVPPNTTAVEIQNFYYRSKDLVNWELYPPTDEGIQCDAMQCHEGGIVMSQDNNYYIVNRNEKGSVGVASIDSTGLLTSNLTAKYADISHPDKLTSRILMNSDSPITIRHLYENKYILLYYNCRGSSRNPIWISGGQFIGTQIHWLQPEILLYHPDPSVKFAYSDFNKYSGVGNTTGYYLTESTKLIGRIHFIPQEFVDKLFITINSNFNEIKPTYSFNSLHPGQYNFTFLNVSSTVTLNLHISGHNSTIYLFKNNNLTIHYKNQYIYANLTIGNASTIVQTEQITDTDISYTLVINKEINILITYVNGVLQSGQLNNDDTLWKLVNLTDFICNGTFIVEVDNVISELSYYNTSLSTHDIISDYKYHHQDGSKKDNTVLIVVICSIVGVIILVIIGVFILYRSYANKGKMNEPSYHAIES